MNLNPPCSLLLFSLLCARCEHRRNIDLGIHQRAPVDSHRDRTCDVDVVDPRTARFHGKDWLFLFGHPREKLLSLHLWLRFAALWVAVFFIGFVEGYVLLPFGLIAFLGGVLFTALVVWRVAPKWLR